MEYRMNQAMIDEYKIKMQKDEKSKMTIEKYVRDIQKFLGFVGENTVFDKEKVIAYKQQLIDQYAPASVNSMLAAMNSFLRNQGGMNAL